MKSILQYKRKVNKNEWYDFIILKFQDTHNLDNSLSGTTLANLKKQRAQSRSSTTSENGSLIGGNQTIASTLLSGQPMLELTDQTPKITKFSGVTSDVVSDSTSSRRCCTIMWIMCVWEYKNICIGRDKSLKVIIVKFKV